MFGEGTVAPPFFVFESLGKRQLDRALDDMGQTAPLQEWILIEGRWSHARSRDEKHDREARKRDKWDKGHNGDDENSSGCSYPLSLLIHHIQGRLDSPRRRTRICVVGQAGRADNEKTKVVARRLALVSNTVQASVASARICGSQACALRHGMQFSLPLSCSAQLTHAISPVLFLLFAHQIVIVYGCKVAHNCHWPICLCLTNQLNSANLDNRSSPPPVPVHHRSLPQQIDQA